MSATAGQAQDHRDLAGRLGIKPGQVVQEIGYDDDCDEELRDAIAGGKTSNSSTRIMTMSWTWSCCGGGMAMVTSSMPLWMR